MSFRGSFIGSAGSTTGEPRFAQKRLPAAIEDPHCAHLVSPRPAPQLSQDCESSLTVAWHLGHTITEVASRRRSKKERDDHLAQFYPDESECQA